MSDPMGYVVDTGGESFTYCVGCAERADAVETGDALYDSSAFGATVPYPECHDCGQVIRPDTT